MATYFYFPHSDWVQRASFICAIRRTSCISSNQGFLTQYAPVYLGSEIRWLKAFPHTSYWCYSHHSGLILLLGLCVPYSKVRHSSQGESLYVLYSHWRKWRVTTCFTYKQFLSTVISLMYSKSTRISEVFPCHLQP
jgi:hypothetical protein